MTALVHKIVSIVICALGCATLAHASQEPPQTQEVLEFWFGHLETSDDYPSEKASIWFSGGDDIDNEIRHRFGNLVIAASNDELNEWKQTPRGRLALIILLDQFTRNIYRGSPQAFASDLIAQDLTLEGLAFEQDQELLPIERIFFYFPLEHAESMELQTLSVEKFHSVLTSVPSKHMPQFLSFEDYAWRHYDVIAKFGRFPHRNTILNRESTPQELEYLNNP